MMEATRNSSPPFDLGDEFNENLSQGPFPLVNFIRRMRSGMKIDVENSPSVVISGIRCSSFSQIATALVSEVSQAYRPDNNDDVNFVVDVMCRVSFRPVSIFHLFIFLGVGFRV